MPKHTILITGCTPHGIGHAVACGLKARGYTVIATARKPAVVEQLKQEGFYALPLDLANAQSIESAVRQTLEYTNGQLYGLFNNGAYGQPGAVEDLTLEALREQFETNFFGWHHLTRQVLPIMRQQGAGRIIQNSSLLGYVALKYRGAYNASKYALEGLTDTLRLELSGSGVYISLVEPGPIASHFRTNAFEAFKRHIMLENSVHQATYQAMIDRLQKPGPAVPFTLPCEAVLPKVIHALESKHPKARYPVTFPAYLLAALKRLLPTQLLDKTLLKLSD